MKEYLKTNLIAICSLMLTFITGGGLITLFTLSSVQQKAKVEVETLQVSTMSTTIGQMREYSATMSELAIEHLKARKEMEKELTDVLHENTTLKARLEKAFREIEKLQHDVKELHQQVAKLKQNPCG